ncbi:MAG: ADOP family duplicated permease [Thermoanaerobaculia bacterium]|nr:ADOP family duplicated permease [Thermoanaerobaculia bacterium]
MTRRRDEDFYAEIESHLQLEIDQLIEEGVDPTEAEGMARRRFGNVMRTQERFYESSRWMFVDHLVRNTRYALRQMKSSPISTAAILLSLALGVGLNVSIFSIADQVMVRTLPVEAPESLAQLQWDGFFPVQGLGSKGSGHLVPFPLYERVRSEIDSFSEVFARAPADAHLGLGDQSIPTRVELVTGSYFNALGVRSVVGRLLDDEADREPDAHPVIVLSHWFWQRHFASDRDVIGREVHLNGTPFRVVGVAERGFRGTDWSQPPALWASIQMVKAIAGHGGLDEHRSRFTHVFARLVPGNSAEEAAAELEPFFEAYKRADMQRDDWPSLTHEQMQGFQGSKLRVLDGSRGQAQLGERLQEPVRILSGATALVFLLACLNVANLSLARVFSSRRATALRTALGASRRRLIGESLIESGLFALMGSAVGLALAPAFARWVVTLVAPAQGGAALPPIDPALDLRVLIFAFAVAVCVTIVAGTAPAIFASSVRPIDALQQRSDGAGSGLRLRKLLVTCQFALALVLLLGAGLFTQSLRSLRLQGPGYETENLLSFQIDPRLDGFSTQDAKKVTARILERLQTQPEVAGAGVAAFEMLIGGGWNNPVTVTHEGRHVPTDHSIPMNAVTPGFFEALGTPILAGRAFDEQDRTEEGWDLSSVIVNREFVDRYLHGALPIGERLAFGISPDAKPSIEVVGVVESFRDFGIREPEPHVFFALWERTVSTATFYVRTTTESSIAEHAVRRTLREIDPGLTLVSIRTLDDQLDLLLANERVLANLATAFAAVATMLAVIGLYGLLAFSAEQRFHEIGIRMALGARGWSAAGLIVREALVLAVLGLVVAVPISWSLGNLVRSQLYGIEPMDLAVVAAAGMSLLILSLLSSAVPARKVARIDPLEALRTE